MHKTILPDESAERGRFEAALIDVWNGTEHGVIGDAIDQWRRRLRVCVFRPKDTLNIHCDFLISSMCSVKICR